MSKIDKLADATILGIIYHPEIRERLFENTKRDVAEMVRTLAHASVKARDAEYKQMDRHTRESHYENGYADGYKKAIKEVVKDLKKWGKNKHYYWAIDGAIDRIEKLKEKKDGI